MGMDDPFRQHTEPPAAEGRGGATGPSSGPGGFAIAQQDLDGTTSVLTVEGELDLATAPSLKWALGDLVDAGRTRIVLDLSAVPFIDSTALGVLVGVRRAMGAGGRLAVVCTNVNVLKIFELTGLDSAFSCFASTELALAHIRGSAAATG